MNKLPTIARLALGLAFFGFGPAPGRASGTCDARPFPPAGVARARLVLATSVGYAFRF